MKTLKEKIAVMQASDDGAEIEVNFEGDDRGWMKYHCAQDLDMCWNWNNDYRIKPKPLEWYENIPEGGVLCWAGDCDNEKVIEKITRHISGASYPFRSQSNSAWGKSEPLTKKEIQVFMDNAPEVKND